MPALSIRLNSPSPAVRRTALFAIGRLRTDQSAMRLRAAVEEPLLQESAVQAIAIDGRRCMLKVLRQVEQEIRPWRHSAEKERLMRRLAWAMSQCSKPAPESEGWTDVLLKTE